MYSQTPYISLCVFALTFTPNPFQTFWLHSFKTVSQVCSVFYKVMTVSHNWILYKAAMSSVRVVSICLRFGLIFLCVRIPCKKCFVADQSETGGLSAASKQGLCLSCTKSTTLVKVNGTKAPEPGYRFSTKFIIIRTFWTALLDNISKLLMETDSLVTVSDLSLPFLFRCSLEPHFRISEWTRSKPFPNVFCILKTDDPISKFNFAESCKIEGPGGLDLFEVWTDSFLRQNILQKALRCWAI